MRMTAAASVAALLWVGVARAGSVSPDDAITLVAEVVADRARLVAAETLALRLRKQLCSHTPLVLPPTGATAAATTTITLGGTKACVDDRTSCNADDVFAETCRLAEGDELPFTDPSFLKTVTRDTVELLLRVSARELSREEYEAFALPQLAEYLHEAMETLSQAGASIASIVEPTLRLADALAGTTARDILGAVGDEPGTAALIDAVERQVVAQCKSIPDAVCADIAPGSSVASLPQVTAKGDRGRECQRYFAAKAPRDAKFTEYFSGPLMAARTSACELAGVKDVGACVRNHAVRGFLPPLLESACAAVDADPRRHLRGLVATLDERAMHEKNLARLGVQPELVAEFYAGLTGVLRRRVSRAMPTQELAAALRIVAHGLLARRDDPAGAAQWLELVRQDLRAAQGVRPLIGGSALDRDRRNTLSPSVQALRDAVADLVSLPWVVLLRDAKDQVANESDEAVGAATDAIRAFLGEVAGARDVASRPDDLLAWLVGYFRAISKVSLALAPLSDDGALRLQNVGLALRLSGEVVSLAARRDWVGVGLRVSSAISQTGDKGKELERSLRFARTLLSMYQARSRDEAKGILEGALTDAGSRRRRYADDITVDVAALAGVFPGYSRARSFDAATHHVSGATEAVALGFYAPVGLEVAHRCVGGLFYPLDVGAYLNGRVTTRESGTESGKAGEVAPRWPDALRFGAAFVIRPSGDVPLVFGAAADYRPRYDDHDELRVLAYVALELALFALY